MGNLNKIEITPAMMNAGIEAATPQLEALVSLSSIAFQILAERLLRATLECGGYGVTFSEGILPEE